MAIRGDETYVTVEGLLVKVTPKAILIATEEAGEGWVARSCCHFSTDRAVDTAELGVTMEFKIMEWVAEKNGFI